ncbi:hypothetical protein D9757_008550 [Collybiopsis confluens]|uniref:SH3 domain-containing protein n=1 Tax=Collybiopsis confluens TaxID=2823264 RepID=A0A8H5H2Z1_9AGAR|nr:hypothetical protein D9757_008550 [Collybiopsis confluens]
MSADAIQHIVSQIQQNVEFLIQHQHLSRNDASTFLSRLDSIGSGATATRKALLVLSPPGPTMAKALWAYNEDGTDPNDLAFSAGDMIEIVEETNPDWWTEMPKAPARAIPLAASPTPVGARTLPPVFTGAKEKPVYKPFGAAHQSANAPPPASATIVNNVGLQSDDLGQDRKKNKYGKYGDTMAHSAAAGVGLGAGSAIGGGLVRGTGIPSASCTVLTNFSAIF